MDGCHEADKLRLKLQFFGRISRFPHGVEQVFGVVMDGEDDNLGEMRVAGYQGFFQLLHAFKVLPVIFEILLAAGF